MKGIGGNKQGIIQVCTSQKNAIGEQVKQWEDVQILLGWLDYASSINQNSSYTTYYAKVQESTHVFVADWTELDQRIKMENARMLIDGKAYDITLIDNPMEMKSGSQLEIFLKYTGGR